MKNIYQSDKLNRKIYQVPLDNDRRLITQLEQRNDVQADRLLRYLKLSDLTREANSPLHAVISAVLSLDCFARFDIIKTPEIISPRVVFDLFNFPTDHSARSASDTYYVDDNHILRPHTSMMWKYYFDIDEAREKLNKNGLVGALSYGKIYRRDEIDWQHSNVSHQFDGLFVCDKSIADIKQADLEDVCREATGALLGENRREQVLVDTFPYTDPSIEFQIQWDDDQWVEVNGAGIVHPQVLENLNIDSQNYNGWAFGFGVDRLAMLKMRIPDIRLLRSQDPRVTSQLADFNKIYEPVSKYPPVIRDISFIVEKDKYDLNGYYELVREVVGGDYVEEVELLDKYENEEKFGTGKISYTFRVMYRHLEKTLTSEEVNALHEKLHQATEEKYGAKVRKV